jgi:beta-galactosidase
VDPPHVPYDQNETGCYLKTFEVPKTFKGDQLRLRFEGVDSAFHVWVNGKEIGYSQGSRNPSEFDITKSVYFGGENVLAVKVYQYSDGSYIEDQVGTRDSMALHF